MKKFKKKSYWLYVGETLYYTSPVNSEQGFVGSFFSSFFYLFGHLLLNLFASKNLYSFCVLLVVILVMCGYVAL